MGEIMQFVKPAAAGMVIFVAFAGTAVADSDWQTIQAAGDPRITIDIPAAVHQESAADPKKGELMAFFAANSEGDETLACFLNRNEYSKNMNAQAWQAALQSKDAAMMCDKNGANISNHELDTYASTTSSGYVASTCDAAYTDGSEKLKGGIISVMSIAAPDAFYTLTCEVGATDKDEAIAAWLVTWKDVVAHVQTSLQLPAPPEK